jgi:hypothetical protein
MQKEYEELVGRYEEYYFRKGLVVGCVCTCIIWILALIVWVTR